MARSGALRARIHDALPLSQAAEAHRLGEAGRIDGKLVLVV
jgi:NADPH:quinone reductase-like Zn-dependent oxidoreductase